MLVNLNFKFEGGSESLAWWASVSDATSTVTGSTLRSVLLGVSPVHSEAAASESVFVRGRSLPLPLSLALAVRLAAPTRSLTPSRAASGTGSLRPMAGRTASAIGSASGSLRLSASEPACGRAALHRQC